MQKSKVKRVISMLLCAGMLASFMPSALAEEKYNGKESYFDFDASEYEVAENGELSIKLVRHGDGNAAADVMVKAADVLSSYGADYVITNEQGESFEQVDGEKPDLKDFVFESDEQVAEEATEDAAEQEDNTEKPDALPQNENKVPRSTGSNLLDAANDYLNIVPGSTDDESKKAIEKTLDEMHQYFTDAEGAAGIVHFNIGETEKEIHIKPIDNDKPDSARVFALALLATGDELTTIAANATTYVNLVDDEDAISPRYSISADKTTLTAENPTAEVTVHRTEGTENFTTAYLSTVKQTAVDGSYERFAYKEVTFVPNETEKKITVSALDFSKGGVFGLRVESDNENAKFDTYYIDFTIESENGEAQLASADGADAELMASTELGSKVLTLDDKSGAQHNRLGPSSYWKFEKNGSDNDNKAYYSGSDPNSVIHVQQFDKGKYSMGRTARSYNLAGIYKLRYSMKTWSNHSSKTDIDTYFTISGSSGGISNNVKSNKVHGKSGWTERELNVGDANGSYYIKFYAYACASGYHNPHAELDWVHRYYTRYALSPQPAAEPVYREVYDFTKKGTDGTYPLVSQTYYEGANTLAYNPEVKVTYSGSDVSAFYANAGKTVTISPKDADTMDKYGLELAGVYFARSDISAAQLYISKDKSYRKSNVYKMNASGNKVSVTLNQSFVSTLINNGVVNSANAENESIKIYPIFRHKTVKVTLKNADVSGDYTESNQGSHFMNVIDAWKSDGGRTSSVSATNTLWKDGTTGYSFNVPMYAVIRLKSEVLSSRSAQGAYYAKSSGAKGTTYYVAGKKSYSLTNPANDTIENTDTTMAEVVADASTTTITPATNSQTFYVSYSPVSRKSILKELGSLKNAAYVGDLNSDQYQTTDGNGEMWISNPYIGAHYSINAIPPEGYYVSWANMTGDTNRDGEISKSAGEGKNIRSTRDYPDDGRKHNPLYLYGDRINVDVDMDDMKYYFQYKGKSDRGIVTKTGKVVRENNSFYRLTKGYAKLGTEPVIGAYMDIAGFIGQTDANGQYSIDINGLDDWGAVSMGVTTADNFYALDTSIETTGDTITLPAFDVFNAYSTSAAYDEKTGSANGTTIAVEDDKLTITAGVTTSTAYTPSGAHFYIYRNGAPVIDCSDDDHKENYKTTFSPTSTVYTASLTFNPEADIMSGDRVYVSFCDQNGKYYTPIDMGYTFVKPLTMEEFVMPLIGSESIDNAFKTMETWDIIGSPLSNLMTGPLKGVNRSATYTYTPSAVEALYGEGSANAELYTWSRSDYTFGWNKTFGDKKKLGKGKGKAGDDEIKETMKDVDSGDLKGKKVPDSKYATKGNFTWSVTPEVGFKLTLSTRKDKNYFEDLVFYVGANASINAKQKISLPYGFNMLIAENLDIGVVGVYHMYNDYIDPLETTDATEYDVENFGLFKNFTNAVRREGYIFLNPTIGIDFAAGWTIIDVNIKATFAFDMDFQFTEHTINDYGSMNIKLDWGIKLFGFQVYSSKIDEWNVPLFHTEGTNNHIEFDYKDGVNLASVMENEGEYSLDRTESKDYLKNRSGWMEGGIASLLSDVSDGTQETELRKGSADDPRVRMARINDEEILMVFVDDDTSRITTDEDGKENSKNSRAVYYSIFTNGAWKEPVLLEDDGKLDGSPEICDLGDKILVAWSGIDHVLGKNDDVISAVHDCNMHTVFFDKATKKFDDDIKIITKTTDLDTAADTMPKAVYDEATDKLILYYTKMELPTVDTTGMTEEEAAKAQLNFNKVNSVGAYLFYDDTNGWQTGDDVYTDDELTGKTGEERADYIENWYGQRFLDLRIDKKGGLPRMVDSNAIGFDGKAFYTWTVDWDGDINTLYDRDIFMQIYSFADNTFSRLIKVTENSSYYASPKFAHSDTATYLFYGKHDGTNAENAENYEAKDSGEIVYINLNKIYENGSVTSVENDTTSYLELKYTQPAAETKDSKGNTITTPEQTVWVEAQKAADCDNIGDYSLFVGATGNVLLFWTESENGGRQVKVAMYSGDDADQGANEDAAENEESEADSDALVESNADTAVSGWSQPFTLTSGKDIYYSGIYGAALKKPNEEYGKIYVVGGKGSHKDESQKSMVLLVHTPYSKAEITDVTVDAEHPRPGDSVKVTAMIENSGMVPYTDEITVDFDVNGESKQTVTLNKAISGGETVQAEAYLTVPDDVAKLDFTAKLKNGNDVKTTLEAGSNLTFAGEEIVSFANAETDNTYIAEITNEGNKNAENITITAETGETAVADGTIESIGYGETEQTELALDIPDSAYEIDENGIGIAEVTVTASAGDKTLNTFTGTASKVFSGEAIKLLKDAKVDEKVSFTIKSDAEGPLQPQITGSGKDDLIVYWLTSSDQSVAYIDSTNAVIAASEGTTTMTGILAPNSSIMEMDENGRYVQADWKELIPEDMHTIVTAEVTVSDTEETPARRSSGGGGGSSTYSVSTSSKTYNNGSVALSKKNASKGETVTVTATPDEGYEVDTITVTDAKGNVIELTKLGDNEYSFVMPAGKVSVDVSYKESGSEPSATEKPSKDDDRWFTDVPENTWYYEPIKYAYNKSLMSGVSDDEFAPETDITRGMFVTVLHRLDGEPDEDKDYTFTDVAENAYYADAVKWGSANGIIAGYSDTEFAPDDKITREQLAAIMYRYAKYKDYDVSAGEDTNILSYTDAEDISEYAVSSMQWICGEGIVSGFEDNTLRPQANTTRAQTAVILQKFTQGQSDTDKTEEKPFEIAPLEGAPTDYSDSSNWLNIPDMTKEVDTIYFYPTAYMDTAEDAPMICDVDNEGMRKQAQSLFDTQASAYAESTNVFAPYYRQTNIYALTGKSADEFEDIQRGVQRTDMYASLDYYFENYNNGKPFILAGHSQGSEMCKIALDEYFRAHPEYLERMVAAYPLGYSFTAEWLDAHPYLKFAEGADDTGVIVSWNTEGPENKEYESSVVLSGAQAINPLNWKRDEIPASKEENLGSLVKNDKGEYEIIAGLNDAAIDTERGVVVCTTSDAYVPIVEIFGPASLHGQDYALYYANIQDNVKTRIEAYFAENE